MININDNTISDSGDESDAVMIQASMNPHTISSDIVSVETKGDEDTNNFHHDNSRTVAAAATAAATATTATAATSDEINNSDSLLQETAAASAVAAAAAAAAAAAGTAAASLQQNIESNEVVDREFPLQLESKVIGTLQSAFIIGTNLLIQYIQLFN